jgi:hypothetical protein
LYPRCPGCEALSRPRGDFPILDMPEGTAQWLLNAAREFAAMGDEGAVEFALWVSVDLREVQGAVA